MRDLLDLGSAAQILKDIERGAVRVSTIESTRPSPFASALLFSYIANYIYEGDAPLAERRAQALSIDQSQLEEILGSTDFRELLDKAAMDEVEAHLQSLDPEYHARHTDGLHDLLLKLGDLTGEEIEGRSVSPEVASSVANLVRTRRAVSVRIGSETRYIPVEYAARYRDGLGTPLPPGLAETFLAPVPHALTSILRRYARTHGPFTTSEVALRYNLALEQVETNLRQLHIESKLLEGEFRPGGVHREWCDPDVLQQIRRKSLARLRREVVPAEQHVFARLLVRWQGANSPRRGMDALVDAIENLQGAELIASDLEREILPARIAEYRTSDLDTLLASGEIVWVGRAPLGRRDGRVSLYLTDALRSLFPPAFGDDRIPGLSERAKQIYAYLLEQGASFHAALHQAAGGGFPNETTDALWELVWAGLITNDTYHPVRSLLFSPEVERHRAQPYVPPGSPEFLQRLRARRGGSWVGQGRWSALKHRVHSAQSPTDWSIATAQQLLVRYGVVMRETAAAEDIPGGYAAIYPALKTMEENGWIRRGMFVAGMGAAQFANPKAVDMLRSLRNDPERADTVHLAASDPANPYGSLLPWVQGSGDHTMSRSVGANVILVNGQLAGFFRRRNPAIVTFLPEEDPERGRVAKEVAQKLAAVAIRHQTRRGGLLIATIDGTPAGEHVLARFLQESGFVLTAAGFQMRRVQRPATEPPAPEEEFDTEDA
jgi:ATP-dependent Lhr-like helicase